MAARFLLGNKFIQALTDAGLLPDATTSVTIRAVLGDPVTLDYEVIGDARLLDITGAIQVTDDPEKAIAR